MEVHIPHGKEHFRVDGDAAFCQVTLDTCLPQLLSFSLVITIKL